MESTISKPTVNMDDYVLSVSKGGTGSTSAAGAATNLNLARIATKDMANGVIGLDANSKISASAFPAPGNKVNVTGLFSVPVTKSVTAVITDYDSSKIYSVSCTGGNISSGGNGSMLTYTAGSVQGPASITINGRVFPFTILPPIVTAPTITSPVNNATQLNADITITASAFSSTLGNVTHTNTDWQISTNNTFTSIARQSLADAVNLTSWSATGLTANTTYYIRTRHKGSNGDYSDYSPTTIITTKAVYIPSTEQAKISASDKATTDYFGSSVGIDNDATRVAIGARNASVGGTSTCGVVYIFLRTGSSWALEAKLNATDKVSGDMFGSSVAMATDGTRIVVGAYGSDVTTTDTGAAYIFSRTGTTWTQEAKLTASDRLASDYFASTVAMDKTCTRVICGVYYSDPGGLNAAGAAYVYVRSGTTWTQEAKLLASDRAANEYFGTSVSMNGDGTLAMVGCPAKSNSTGAVYIYSRATTTWTQEAKLLASDGVTSDNFGSTCAMSDVATGCRVIISAHGKSSFAGAAYVFLRTGTTWAQEAKLLPSVAVAGDSFGYNVSISFNGDRIILGAQSFDNVSPSMTNCGAIYIFTRTGTTWTEGARVMASDKAANDAYGSAVRISGNGVYAIVGVPQAGYTGMTNAGAAYILN